MTSPTPALTPMALVAATMHELFTELQAQGFNRDDALEIVVRMAK